MNQAQEIQVVEAPKTQTFNLLILWHNGTTRHKKVEAQTLEQAIEALSAHYLLRHVPSHFAIGTDENPPQRPTSLSRGRGKLVAVAASEAVATTSEAVATTSEDVAASETVAMPRKKGKAKQQRRAA